MGLDLFGFKQKQKNLENEFKEKLDDLQASYSRPIFSVSYDGEKTPGEIGLIKDYVLDYYALRIRSWQSYVESEITQTVIGKLDTWIFGSGLKLQCEPELSLIGESSIESNDFASRVEKLYKLYSDDDSVDYSCNQNLHEVASEVYKNATIGGDCLVILRIDKKTKIVTVQAVDGSHLKTPVGGSVAKGNRVKYGVEVNKKGKHVAYHIYNTDGKYQRVKAYDSTGQFRMAWLEYGHKMRIGDTRGAPLILAVLEKLKKLDRYDEAVLGAAEEINKIPYFFEHDVNSTGENPLIGKMKNSLQMGMGTAPETRPFGEETTAEKIALTTNKSVHNLPIGTTLKVPAAADNQNIFKDFFTMHINLVCATLNIPPEVAMSMYNSNYSASRAAIKDWEHVLRVKRSRVKFYKHHYKLWLTNEALKDKLIKLPLYVDALLKGDKTTVLAYQNARFVGPSVPNIDPVKEVTAIRKKLGNENVPLISHEEAVEQLGDGDWNQNITKYEQEIESHNLVPQQSNTTITENNNNDGNNSNHSDD